MIQKNIKYKCMTLLDIRFNLDYGGLINLRLNLRVTSNPIKPRI